MHLNAPTPKRNREDGARGRDRAPCAVRPACQTTRSTRRFFSNTCNLECRALLALRNREPALLRGRTEGQQAQGSVFSYWRKEGADALLVVHNTARGANNGISIGGAPALARLARQLGSGADVSASAQGNIVLDLPAQSTHVFKVQP